MNENPRDQEARRLERRPRREEPRGGAVAPAKEASRPMPLTALQRKAFAALDAAVEDYKVLLRLEHRSELRGGAYVKGTETKKAMWEAIQEECLGHLAAAFAAIDQMELDAPPVPIVKDVASPAAKPQEVKTAESAPKAEVELVDSARPRAEFLFTEEDR